MSALIPPSDVTSVNVHLNTNTWQMLDKTEKFVFIWSHKNSLQNKCRTAEPDQQNLGRSGKLSFFIIFKFWQNCALVPQVSDLILKTVRKVKYNDVSSSHDSGVQNHYWNHPMPSVSCDAPGYFDTNIIINKNCLPPLQHNARAQMPPLHHIRMHHCMDLS